MGKTRLAEEASSLAEATHEAAVLEGRCVPYGEANVWWPIAEALRDGTGIHADDVARRGPPALHRTRWRPCSSSRRRPTPSARVADGLLFLIGLPTALDSLDPARAREDAALSLFSFIEAYLRVRPVLVVLSDLHWADDLVLDLLDRMLRALGSLPFVVVATAARRPRLPLAAAGASQHARASTSIRSTEPPRASCSTRSQSRACRRRLADQLLDRSGGNPFFLEELASLVCDTAETDDDLPDLPDNIRGLVAARIDTLVARRAGHARRRRGARAGRAR